MKSPTHPGRLAPTSSDPDFPSPKACSRAFAPRLFSAFAGGCLLVLGLCHTVSMASEPCDSITTFADNRTPLREVFVSPTGNNSTGNGSRSKPFQTIARALNGYKPGDAIRLLPGTYSGGTFVNDLAGTSNAPVWIGGITGESRPVINGGSSALQLVRAKFLVVENLEVANSTSNGINCDDGGAYANPQASHHLVFRNLLIRNIGTGGNQDGLKLSGIYDYAVVGCDFRNGSAGGSGIDHVGCHRGIIVHSRFTDMGGNAIQCKGGSEDIEIRANRVVNGGGRAINIGGSTGFEFFRPPLSKTVPNVEARNIRVLANVFVGAEAPLAFVGAVECVAANNTFVEPGRWLFRILQETVTSGGYTFLPSGNNRFVNNLVYFSTAQVAIPINIGPNTASSTFQFANNLWYAFNRPAQSKPTLPATESKGLYGLNPLLRDPVNADYSVPPNSPATGKGLALPFLRADLLDQCLPPNPTIGAFEAHPLTASTDTDSDRMPDLWERANAFDATNPDDAQLDADGDGLINFGEWLAGTHPRDATSRFTIHLTAGNNPSLQLQFPTQLGRIYTIQSRTPDADSWTDDSTLHGTGFLSLHPLPKSQDAVRFTRVRIDLQ